MNLLIDENIGKPLSDALAALLKFAEPPPHVEHIRDFTGQYGVKDEVWVPRLAAEDWTVITGDLGRGGGPRLPALCKLYRVRHILFSPRLSQKKQFEKARVVLAAWPQIVAAAHEAPGTRFRLRLKGHHVSLSRA